MPKESGILEQLLSLFPMVEPTLAQFPPRTVAAWQKHVPFERLQCNRSISGHLKLEHWSRTVKNLTAPEARTEPGHASASASSSLVRKRTRNIFAFDNCVCRRRDISSLIFLPEFESNPSTSKLKHCAPLCFKCFKFWPTRLDETLKLNSRPERSRERLEKWLSNPRPHYRPHFTTLRSKRKQPRHLRLHATRRRTISPRETHFRDAYGQ